MTFTYDIYIGLAWLGLACLAWLGWAGLVLKNHVFYHIFAPNLLFECVLLYFRSHMCKKPYKTSGCIGFCDHKVACLMKILVRNCKKTHLFVKFKKKQ